jgi:hypothetical protein
MLSLVLYSGGGIMSFSIWLVFGTAVPARRPARRRLGLERLEGREVPSGGLSPSGSSGGPQQAVALTSGSGQTSGGSGSTSGGSGSGSTSGGQGIPGPGYPLLPPTGPTISTVTTDPTTTTTVVVPISGTPGGSTSDLTVVPMSVPGGGPGPSAPAV